MINFDAFFNLVCVFWADCACSFCFWFIMDRLAAYICMYKASFLPFVALLSHVLPCLMWRIDLQYKMIPSVDAVVLNFYLLLAHLCTCRPIDPVDFMICLPAHGVVIGAWFGAWPVPLDWERPWQVLSPSSFVFSPILLVCFMCKIICNEFSCSVVSSVITFF